ncbi:haloacid dehalogenase type II [Chloroflexia bacterium SDU3-3]|nr:haloacid dehalogenase type II [Chloroflexia bacterium SDU3-3]
MVDLDTKEVLTFDCYGTLIDWESGIAAALLPILQRHGVALEREQALQLFAELESAAEAGPYMAYRDVLASCVRGFGQRYGFAPSAEEQARFAGSVGDWPAFPDSPAALARLASRFRLVVISNVDDDLFALSNARLGVRFADVITAQQAGSYKPSLNNFHVAFERIGVPQQRILHVAQSLFHDHVPAKQLGLDTAWVNRRAANPGFGATLPAEARPDITVPDLQSLADLLCPAAR